MTVCVGSSISTCTYICNFYGCTEIDLSRADFIINTAYLLRSLGISTSLAGFQAFTLLNSTTVPVNSQVLPSIEIWGWLLTSFGFYLIKRTKLVDSCPFCAKYPIQTSYQNMVFSWIRQLIIQVWYWRDNQDSRASILKKSRHLGGRMAFRCDAAFAEVRTKERAADCMHALIGCKNKNASI